MTNTREGSRPKKLFTVELANKTLPLVRLIARDIVRLTSELDERRERLEHLTAGRQLTSDDPYTEELTEVRRQLDRDAAQLQECFGELRNLGVEPKGRGEGLVDFPAMIDGRLAYLCWKLGEPDVRYWHEADAETGDRRLLAGSTALQDATSGNESLGA
ncbi:MAG: DUF2203 domain-containing protein [Pirellulaceae bacterium]|nr:DUF2203 domain-containing protein [Planctomycetales bacterium]